MPASLYPKMPAPPAEGWPEEKTLRDKFAIAALTGLMAESRTAGAFGNDAHAARAYAIADAMMAEREKKGGV